MRDCTSPAVRRKTAQALALGTRIVLTCAEGGQNTEVTAKLWLDQQTGSAWPLYDEPRSGVDD
ncbi:hypothetical protein [Bradyrhizobium sp. F1.13.3]|uniref:hypothetical protein n=1 Tax=Bradyrhizobium sp. F1.13.3 TaxID=3156351 RepID=UPI003396DF68